ncbi:MAG: 16S rRNA (uracil(1498)-N(3))-methyltransferase [Dehalococcoidia bacterium]
MTRRFYVEPPALDADDVRIEGALAHRLSRVLRLRAGDEITLFDGTGSDSLVRLASVSERVTAGEVIAREASAPEPRVRVHLYQSITKGERFEWLLEKATEAGVSRFVPLITARSVVKTPGGRARVDRWRRIAVEAAEQCGRGRVPEVEAPQPFAEALEAAPGLRLLPYEEAPGSEMNIRAALDAHSERAARDVSIFIGPEGGYEAAEVARAKDAGAVVVTLGRRVLRSETAGLVAATLALSAAGELG